jgi:uncharacterized protein (DUF2147 family)
MKFAVLLTWLAWCLPAAAQPSVIGTWMTQNDGGVVQIEPCPTGICGYVVGITKFQPDGATPLDVHGRSRCHLQIIPDGHQDSDGVWSSHITDPDDGDTYTIDLRPDGPDRLHMRGYIGLPLFGRTVYWTRFTGTLTPDCHIR